MGIVREVLEMITARKRNPDTSKVMETKRYRPSEEELTEHFQYRLRTKYNEALQLNAYENSKGLAFALFVEGYFLGLQDVFDNMERL